MDHIIILQKRGHGSCRLFTYIMYMSSIITLQAIGRGSLVMTTGGNKQQAVAVLQ